jgi:hypothetical protein
MSRECVEVLLLAETEIEVAELGRFLQQRGCRCSFASVASAAASLVDHAFDLILCSVPLTQTHPLVLSLTGADCKFFYRFPVEDGCWWIPLDGKDKKTIGFPAVHSSQFAARLESILTELRSGSDRLARRTARDPLLCN